MNKKNLTITLAIFILAAVSAIAIFFLFSNEQQQPPRADEVGSTPQGIQEVADANNQFAFELYEQLGSSQESIFFSPYSVSAAIAMTYEGAKGQTADEITSVFHFPDRSILRPNFAAMYNDLNKENGAYELRTGNALWAQNDYIFLAKYISTVEHYYDGKVANLDFKQETENSRQIINSYIEDQTNNKIKELLPPGVLDSSTRLVLTNAIYFKGTWEWEFDKSMTRELDFKVNPSTSVKTPMMFMEPEKAMFNFADLEKLQLLELPYKGEKISMIIILPKQGEDFDFETGEVIFWNYTLDDVELSADKLREYKLQMKETKLESILVPKFEFDTKYFMKKTLSDLGMPTAFSDIADFSGMDGRNQLQISEVIHQAYVKVDEQGTEAAAATAVVMKERIASIAPTFRADHPFMFIIQEQETGNILFMGRVTDPSK